MSQKLLRWDLPLLGSVELESCCTNHLVKVTRKETANGKLSRNSPFETEKGARKFRKISPRDSRFYARLRQKDPNSKICLYTIHTFFRQSDSVSENTTAIYITVNLLWILCIELVIHLFLKVVSFTIQNWLYFQRCGFAEQHLDYFWCSKKSVLPFFCT